MTTKSAQKLTIKVFSPYQTFFAGSAVSLSARNRVGPFDVLFDHVNFFSLLESGAVVVDTGTQKLTIPISKGFIKVTDNSVVLFANV